jgi:hypothetical protein
MMELTVPVPARHAADHLAEEPHQLDEGAGQVNIAEQQVNVAGEDTASATGEKFGGRHAPRLIEAASQPGSAGEGEPRLIPTDA